MRFLVNFGISFTKIFLENTHQQLLQSYCFFVFKVDKKNTKATLPATPLTPCYCNLQLRRGSRTAATLKMEHFVIIVNGWKLFTIITKSSILDVAAGLDTPLQLLAHSVHLAQYS